MSNSIYIFFYIKNIELDTNFKVINIKNNTCHLIGYHLLTAYYKN